MKKQSGKFLSSLVFLCFLIGFLVTNNNTDASSLEVILTNPGFEDPVVNGVIPGWDQIYGDGGFDVTDTVSHSGDYSLHVNVDNDSKSYGMDSEFIEIDSGETYTASVMTNVKTGQPKVYMRFYDSDKNRIKQYFSGSHSMNQWEELSVTGKAPEEASFASILIYSSVGANTEAYFDDVTLNREDAINENKIEKIGIPIRSVTVPGAAYGPGPNGEEYIYAVANGNPASLSVVNAHTGERVKTFSLPGAHNSWGLTVAPNGTLYIASGRNANMYQWVPGSESITTYRTPIKDESYIWTVRADEEGLIYGGTYPSGKVFQFNPKDNTFRDYGQLIEGIKYTRSVAVGKGKVYAGLGTPAHLVELDTVTGDKKEIQLPEEYQDQKFVYDLSYEGNLLFARLTPANDTLVYDVVQEEWIDTIKNTTAIGDIVSPRGPENKVYIRKDEFIYSYDLRTHELVSTGVQFINGVSASRSFGWIHLENSDYPGRSLVSMTSRGEIFIYNPQNGNHKTLHGDVQGQPTDIQSLSKGPDGRIYIGGYLSPQGMGVYNPETGELKQLNGMSQIEGMGSHNGKLYMGTYPGANIFAYDPTEPWNYGNNPRKLFSLDNTHSQDRPFAFESAGDKLAIGTVPDYGQLGGALTFYDPGTDQFDVHRNVVENQSIIELKYKDGLIYGTTSIWGGYGIDPTETEAKMFIWDVEKGEKVWEGVPVPGEEAVSAVTFDNEGYLWGLTAGHVFKFDPVTREIMKVKEIFYHESGSMYYHGRDLVFDEDGYLYGATLGKVFKINPDTLKVDILAENASLLTQDSKGDIYFSRGTELFKYDTD
ncbi:WD40 repeat domain-containing protein [Virgibacillus kekensis]|uniref:WD40 repeat domain-containing protein n=1 Tax=Virgibacillus kekensis TaxID=202261 RepID=A0ABV9DIT9_9BACI